MKGSAPPLGLARVLQMFKAAITEHICYCGESGALTLSQSWTM